MAYYISHLLYSYFHGFFFSFFLTFSEGILVHKASFGDRLPAPGEKAHSWEPTDDILFGSMSLSSLQSNVEKFGVKSTTTDKQRDKSDSAVKDETKEDGSKSDISDKLDEKLKQLKQETKNSDIQKDEQLVSVETSIPKGGDSFNLTNLPDVVQRPSDSLEHKINKEMDKLKEEELNVDILGEFGNPKKIVPEKDTYKKGSASSLTSLGSDQSGTHFMGDKVKSMSLTNSPLHQSREGSESPGAGKQLQKVSSSLADLQDPNTFTIGTSPKGKRKITKADFLSGETTLNKVDDDDGSDPLSTLDPLWSLK